MNILKRLIHDQYHLRLRSAIKSTQFLASLIRFERAPTLTVLLVLTLNQTDTNSHLKSHCLGIDIYTEGANDANQLASVFGRIDSSDECQGVISDELESPQMAKTWQSADEAKVDMGVE